MTSQSKNIPRCCAAIIDAFARWTVGDRVRTVLEATYTMSANGQVVIRVSSTMFSRILGTRLDGPGVVLYIDMTREGVRQIEVHGPFGEGQMAMLVPCPGWIDAAMDLLYNEMPILGALSEHITSIRIVTGSRGAGSLQNGFPAPMPHQFIENIRIHISLTMPTMPRETFPRVTVEMPTALRGLMGDYAQMTSFAQETMQFMESLPDTPWDMRDDLQHRIKIYYAGGHARDWVVIRAKAGRFECVLTFEFYGQNDAAPTHTGRYVTLMPYRIRHHPGGTYRVAVVGPTGRRLMPGNIMNDLMGTDITVSSLLRLGSYSDRSHRSDCESPAAYVMSDLRAAYDELHNEWFHNFGIHLAFITAPWSIARHIRRYFGTRLTRVEVCPPFEAAHWDAINRIRMPVEQLGLPYEGAKEDEETALREQAMDALARRERTLEAAAGSPMPPPEGHQEEEEQKE